MHSKNDWNEWNYIIRIDRMWRKCDVIKHYTNRALWSARSCNRRNFSAHFRLAVIEKCARCTCVVWILWLAAFVSAVSMGFFRVVLDNLKTPTHSFFLFIFICLFVVASVFVVTVVITVVVVTVLGFWGKWMYIFVEFCECCQDGSKTCQCTHESRRHTSHAGLFVLTFSFFSVSLFLF